MASTATARNALMAREFLDWQRKRNRSRETLFISTDVLTKMLAWGDDLGRDDDPRLHGRQRLGHDHGPDSTSGVLRSSPARCGPPSSTSRFSNEEVLRNGLRSRRGKDT